MAQEVLDYAGKRMAPAGGWRKRLRPPLGRLAWVFFAIWAVLLIAMMVTEAHAGRHAAWHAWQPGMMGCSAAGGVVALAGMLLGSEMAAVALLVHLLTLTVLPVFGCA